MVVGAADPAVYHHVVVSAGFSWGNILGTVASVLAITAIIAPFLVRSVRRNLEAAVTAVVKREVMPEVKLITDQLAQHEVRIIALEGYNQGRQAAYQERKVT